MSGRLAALSAAAATNQSPVAVKAGAFRLAAYVDPEPVIVSVAIASLVKNIARTRVAVVAHKPHAMFVGSRFLRYALAKLPSMIEFSRSTADSSCNRN